MDLKLWIEAGCKHSISCLWDEIVSWPVSPCHRKKQMGTEMVTGCVGQGDAAFFIQLRCAMEYIFFFFPL